MTSQSKKRVSGPEQSTQLTPDKRLEQALGAGVRIRLATNSLLVDESWVYVRKTVGTSPGVRQLSVMDPASGSTARIVERRDFTSMFGISKPTGLCVREVSLVICEKPGDAAEGYHAQLTYQSDNDKKPAQIAYYGPGGVLLTDEDKVGLQHFADRADIFPDPRADRTCLVALNEVAFYLSSVVPAAFTQRLDGLETTAA